MISLILDIIVLLCLGATIFYAMRLSTALNNFKAHRKEFEGLMADLSQNIAQAQAAMTGMKAARPKISLLTMSLRLKCQTLIYHHFLLKTPNLTKIVTFSHFPLVTARVKMVMVHICKAKLNENYSKPLNVRSKQRYL